MIISTETSVISSLSTSNEFLSTGEEIGDAVYAIDPALSLKVYLRLNLHEKVLKVLMTKRLLEEIPK